MVDQMDKSRGKFVKELEKRFVHFDSNNFMCPHLRSSSYNKKKHENRMGETEVNYLIKENDGSNQDAI